MQLSVSLESQGRTNPLPWFPNIKNTLNNRTVFKITGSCWSRTLQVCQHTSHLAIPPFLPACASCTTGLAPAFTPAIARPCALEASGLIAPSNLPLLGTWLRCRLSPLDLVRLVALGPHSSLPSSCSQDGPRVGDPVPVCCSPDSPGRLQASASLPTTPLLLPSSSSGHTASSFPWTRLAFAGIPASANPTPASRGSSPQALPSLSSVPHDTEFSLH